MKLFIEFFLQKRQSACREKCLYILIFYYESDFRAREKYYIVDCFVATLLAMTKLATESAPYVIASEAKQSTMCKKNH